jgi:outer membrane autotransporter protein
MGLTGKIEGNGQINFKTVNTKNIGIQSKYFGNANITGGKLRMSNDNAIIRSAGTDAVRLPEIKFVRDGTITNGAHSKANITVDAGKKAKLSGAITTNEGKSIALAGGSAVLFTNNADVRTRITGDVTGTAEFEGDVVLRKEVNTGNVVFNKDSKTTLHANIEAATEISGEQARVDLANNVKFNNGKVSFKDSAISLDEYQLQLNTSVNNNVTFEGTNTINATMKNVDDNNLVSGGNITMSTGKLKYNNAKFKVSVKDESARPVGETRTYKLLTVATTGVGLDGSLTEKDIEVNPTDRDNRSVMNQWNADVLDNGSIVLKQTDNAKNVLVGLAQEVAAFDGSAAKNMEILASAKPGTAGYNLVDLLARVGHESNSERVNDSKKIITDLENNTAHTQVLTRQVTQFSDNVMTRVGQMQTAVAAGDGNYKYGSWVNPFYSTSEQKARGDLTGYKEESFGASIGFDSEMSSDMVLGAAFNMSKNKVTYEGVKKGDETAVNSFALSLYGMKQINDYWSLSSVATMASSNIKNETKKVSGVGTTRDLTIGENKALSFNGEFTATYSQDIGGAVMSPMGGLRYTRVNATGYKETGSSTQNLDIAAHANDKLEVIAGMKLSVPGLDINGLPVTPDVHASVDYDVLANPNKQTVRLDGMNLASADYKPARAVYNLGVGAHAEYDIWEYGIGYDIQISDKRLGHQGNFKLRVNF